MNFHGRPQRADRRSGRDRRIGSAARDRRARRQHLLVAAVGWVCAMILIGYAAAGEAFHWLELTVVAIGATALHVITVADWLYTGARRDV